MQPLSIKEIEKSRFDEIIRYEHYLHRANSTKPSICYAIFHGKQIVALLEWAAVFKPVLLRFPFLHHMEIVDNARFLVRQELELFEEKIFIYNLGSRSLSMGVKKIKHDWMELTGVKPKLLITYVDCSRGYDGTVYKASNWIEIEQSAGKNYNKKTKIDYKPKPKKTFCYPLIKSYHWMSTPNFSKEFLIQNVETLNPIAKYNYKGKL
jgi:hypothetical protein